jgi:hypothetical protein
LPKCRAATTSNYNVSHATIQQPKRKKRGIWAERSGAGNRMLCIVAGQLRQARRRKFHKNTLKINATPAREVKRRNTKMMVIVHQALPKKAKAKAQSTRNGKPNFNRPQ